MAQKYRLKHPDTGEVRETKDAGTALRLQAHHGYKVDKGTPKNTPPAKTGDKS